MNKLKFFFCFISITVLLSNRSLFGLTDRDAIKEHAKWIEILELKGLNTDPVKVSKRWDSIYKKNTIRVRGKGVELAFDAKTGELIWIINYNKLDSEAKTQDTGR